MSSTKVENFYYNTEFTSVPAISEKFSNSTKFIYNQLIPDNYKGYYVAYNKYAATYPETILKALTIDLNLNLILSPNLLSAAYNTMVAAIIYEVRSDTREILENLGFNDYLSAVITSIVAGSIKGALTGKSILVPSINILAYEMCSSIDYCRDNPEVNIPLTIIAESLDAILGTVNSFGTGNLLGLYNVYNNINNIIEIVFQIPEDPKRAANFQKLYEGALIGAGAGAFAAAEVYGVYIPILEVGEFKGKSILPPIEDYYYDPYELAGDVAEACVAA